VTAVKKPIRRAQSGQALIESGIVVTMLTVLTLGVLNFGYAILVANVVAHSARNGARMAATWPYRLACKTLDPAQLDAIRNQVKAEVASIVGGTFTVNVTQVPVPQNNPPTCTPASNPQVKVEVVGCAPYVFPLLPNFGFFGTACNGRRGFGIDRSAYFADQTIAG
jgi:Flp pilus assembly protein TadG